jgi:DNA-directed RNA polymerase subunit RPC12/RpoP
MCFRPPVAGTKENKCPKCGKVNESVATVCADCGAKLFVMPPPPGQAGGEPPRPAGTPPPRPPGVPPPPPKQPPKPPAPPGKE